MLPRFATSILMLLASVAFAQPPPGMGPPPPGLSLSLSMGVAQANADKGYGAETLFERADAALYEAKQRGRNNVVAADENLRPLPETAAMARHL